MRIPRLSSRRAFTLFGSIVFVAALSAFVIATRLGTSPRSVGYWQGGVHWTPCRENPEVFCGFLEVPTDYDDPSVGTTRLALAKNPTKLGFSKRKGSVLTNWGGPGGSGRWAAINRGERVLHRYCPSYDLISWDPRGIGHTTPTVNCHGTAYNSMITLANTVHETTFDVPPDPFSPAGTAHLLVQQREAQALMQLQGEKCSERMGADVLKYMGTTTLIRDMERISEALEGKDEKINLISGSYGTVVADYLFNMLPEKVGRVLTWGVADPVRWATEHYEDYGLLGELLEDAEATYDWFLQDCFDAAGECPLRHSHDQSPNDIKTRLDAFLDGLYSSPLIVEGATRPGLLKSGMVRATIFQSLQGPQGWPELVQALHEAMQGNGTLLRNKKIKPIPSPNPMPDEDGWIDVAQGDLQRLAVSCADMPPYETHEAWPTPEYGVEKLQGILRDVTPRFGATVNMMEQHGGCQYWPKSKNPIKRFTGPWNATLSNVVLVASNSHDPITPRSAGLAMAERHGESARHIVQVAPGHSYTVDPVSGLLEAVVAYFEHGVIPEEKETVYPSGGRNYVKKL